MKPYQLVLCLTILCLGLSAPAASASLGENPAQYARKNLARSDDDIPLSARYQISSIIGRDQKSYHGTADGDQIALDNPVQQYLVQFSDNGLKLQSGSHMLDMSLQAYGYGNALHKVQPALPEKSGNRITFNRGPLKEWYVNGPYGLQQGFTLYSPPASAKSGREMLTILLSVAGGMETVINPDGLGMELQDENGNPVIRYSGLTVFDADGKDCIALLETRTAGLAIRIDDADARYPLTIDPVFQTAKLTPADPVTEVADAFFGSSVAVSGDTMVVGAPRYDTDGCEKRGIAYVFTRKAPPDEAQWILAARLKHTSSCSENDAFGGSVAISGDTVVVGATGHDVDGRSDQGAAYVFVKPAGGWSSNIQPAELTASDGAANDLFGGSVAIDGNLILVGAYMHDVGANSDQGAAYAFVKPGSGWTSATETDKLTAGDGAAGDRFGISVAVDGSHGVVGAYQFTSNGPGAAYIYSRVYIDISSTWLWLQWGKLTAGDGSAGDQLGRSVAINNDTVVAGAPQNGGTGAAYVFVRPGTTWTNMTQTAKLTTDDGAAGDLFGNSVGISNDTVVVGAWGHDTGGNNLQGKAYVYDKPTDWADMTAATSILGSSDGAVEDRFGNAVAIDGDAVVVGAYTQGNDDNGAAYVFDQPGAGWPATASESFKQVFADQSHTPYFGHSVAMSGDTIVVGAPWEASGGNFAQGAAYLFVKNGGTWGNMTQSVKLLANDGAAGDRFGYSVGISGDRVVVGAPKHEVILKKWAGMVYVFTKPASGWQGSGATLYPTAKLRAGDGTAYDQFGTSVAVSGDTVVVGSPYGPGLAVDNGAAYVFQQSAYGQGATYTHTAKLVAGDGGPTDYFGEAVAIDGDTVLVGASRNEVNSNQFQGAAYVFVEPAGGWASVAGNMEETAKLVSSDGAADDNLGRSVALSGDLAVAGAQNAAYVFTKPAAGWSGTLGENSKLITGTAIDPVSYFSSFLATNGHVVARGAYIYGDSSTDWSTVSGTVTEKKVLQIDETTWGMGLSVAVSGTDLVAGSLWDTAYVFTDVGRKFPWTMFLPAIIKKEQ